MCGINPKKEYIAPPNDAAMVLFGNVTKNSFSPKNFVKEHVPTNARFLAKSIFNPSPVTEKDFTDKELNILRETYTNSINRFDSKEAKDAENRANELKRAIKNNEIYSDTPVKSMLEKNKYVPAEQEVEELLPRLYSKSVQYSDYPNEKYYSDNHPIYSTLTNKVYQMGTTIGRANYYKDKDGNVHIIDNYNFGNIDTRANDDFKKLSSSYKAAERLGNKYGKQMPVDINLGKIDKKDKSKNKKTGIN